MKTEIC